MARKNMEELIHCNVCGEDYSATYRRCPFCGERMDVRPVAEDEDFDDGYVFDGQALFDDDPDADQAAPNKGGKRLAASGGSKSAPQKTPAQKSSGQKGAPVKSSVRYSSAGPVNWVRAATFGLSLIIIIAALIIVFTVIYPRIHQPDDPSGNSTPPGTSSVDPGNTDTPPGTSTVDPGNTETPPVTGSPEPTTPIGQLGPGAKGYIVGATGGLRVRSGPGTTYDILASLVNGDEVTIVEDAGNGWFKINYSGAGGQAATGYIMGEYISVQSGGSSTTTPDPEPTTSTGTGALVPGAKGTIVVGSSGLNVRSGPGTTYSIDASLFNGNEITILEDAGNGWFKIAYAGANGQETVGYIKGEFIKVN